MAHEAGAIVVADGAQGAPKLPLDVAALGADFYAITGHKLYAPTGIGALWGKLDLLRAMPPFLGGGSMIRKVTRDGTTYADVPARFEAGTPAIAQAIGMGAAIDWLDAELGMDAVRDHERAIADYTLARLAEVPGLKVFGPPRAPERLGPVSFELEGVHAHDVSEILDRHGVAVRAGHHCAQPLMERLGVAATARASFGVYTTTEEIDRLADGLEDARRVFGL
jgi:cysteine desulfurase/selenocysteine lyase